MSQIEKGEEKCDIPPSDGNPPITVSILMPAFNALHTLGEAVASVQAQSHTDWELLIVDDASRDGTYARAEALAAEDIRIRLLRHAENKGAAATRNTALAAAQGRYIAFLDADDLWHPDKLRRQLAFMAETGAAFSYTGFWRKYSGAGHAQSPGQDPGREVHVPRSVDRNTLLRGNVIGCLTAMYDRAHLGDCPMPDLRMRQDFALWLDILTKTDRAQGLQAPLATHHQRPGSLTSNRLRAMRATWAMYRQHLGLPPHQAFRYMSQHLLRRLLHP